MDLFTQSGNVLVYDDFSDPSSGWRISTGEHGSMGYSNGFYRILVQSSGYDLWSVSGHLYRDVQVEVDATHLAGPVNNRYGPICRIQGGNSFYAFFISSDCYYALARVNNGVASLLGQEKMAYTSFIHQSDTGNRLRLDCIKSSLKGWINGQLVAVASDTEFTRGDVGFIAGAFDEGQRRIDLARLQSQIHRVAR